jgi:hypothetical protein
MAGLNFIFRPAWQAFILLLINIILLIIVRPNHLEHTWILAGAGYGLFILINSIFIWKSGAPWRYFFLSMVISVGYLFVAWAITTGYASITTASGSNESSMVFLIIMYHPFALLVVMFFKWLFIKISR